jgi:hypothetical protein
MSQVLYASPNSFPWVGPRRIDPELSEEFRKNWGEALAQIKLPDWCDRNELAKTLSVETETFYLKHRLSEHLSKVFKYSRSYGEKFIWFAEAMDDYCKGMEIALSKEIADKPHAFYRSDLPISVVTKLNLLKYTQVQTYGFLRKWFNSYMNKASIYKSNRIKFTRYILAPIDHKTGPLGPAFSAADNAGSSFLAYVRVWNASSYDELLHDKPITVEKLDMVEFSKLYQNLEKNLYNLRNTLNHVHPETFVAAEEPTAVEGFLGELLLVES